MGLAHTSRRTTRGSCIDSRTYLVHAAERQLVALQILHLCDGQRRGAVGVLVLGDNVLGDVRRVNEMLVVWLDRQLNGLARIAGRC